ncbi:MAG: hypothetical protein EP348_06420 [Alphaproteobacteria bacterium]|nr:MAG: hypothetical protein EP348_06420 [Alphaproteobacteria bacterium]
MKASKYISLAFSVAIAAGIGTAADAKELKYVFGGSESGLSEGARRFADVLSKETEGRYTAKVYVGNLFGYKETNGALSEGLGDVGFVVAPYFRAEYPQVNFIADLATASSNPYAATGALNEYYMSCKACIDEFKAQNQAFTGTMAIGPYYLYSKPRIDSLESIKGKKIRGFGTFGRWVAEMGGSASVISSNDVYSAMSQGVLDGSTHTPYTIINLSMGEVTDYLLDLPIGLGLGNSLFSTNLDLWKSLSEEDKRAYLKAVAYGDATATAKYQASNLLVLESSPGQYGVEIIKPKADIQAKSDEFRAKDIALIVKNAKEKSGIADAEKRKDRFLKLNEKWEKLVKTIDYKDPEALGKLYYDEVFSKVDLSLFN